MKKRFVFVIFLIIFVLVFTNIYTAAVYIYRAPEKKAYIRLTITDIEDNSPVHGAYVCIPEANACFYTDNNGRTPLIEVPVLYDQLYDDIARRDFGMVTVIVYKEGYVDYILCNLTVRENQKRDGIKLFIYKQNDYSPPFTSIVETPENEWLQKLIDKYRKAN